MIQYNNCKYLKANAMEEGKFDIILMNEEKKLILNETKCLVPCIYKEYKLVNHNPLIGSGKELFGNKSLKLVNLNKR